jgi:phage portal protein BeeE
MQAGIVARTKEFASGNAKESMIVSTETPMSADTQGKIKTAFDTFMKSSSSTSLFLNTKLDTKLVSSAMTGADMLAFFKEVNQVIINSFNLPPHLLGDLSRGGANKDSETLYAIRIWFTTNLLPVLRNIELHFTRYFRLQLGLKQAVVKFDLSDIDILDDFIEMKTDRAIKLSKAGLMSVNEARELVELKPLDDDSANLHFMPAYLLGSAPVSLENFSTEVERLLQDTANTEPLPSGSSGDEDNTSVITDSRGGASDE